MIDNGDFKFICVSGYGKSGSGAVISILNEFNQIGGIKKEFRIARDPMGLSYLHNEIIDNWEFVRHSKAIDNFLDYCLMLSRKETIFSKTGKNLSKILDLDFYEESQSFINAISNFSYFGDTLLNRYTSSRKDLIISRVKSKFKIPNTKKMYFACPDDDFFIVQVQSFMKKIFVKYSTKNNLKKVVLNQAISLKDIDRQLSYFKTNKLIIVDRDPRDIFATMLNEKRLLGGEVDPMIMAEKYIIWHRLLRKNIQPNHKAEVLNIKFEKLFSDYDSEISSIKNFFDISTEHSRKFSLFNPKNYDCHIGIWRKIPNQKAVNKIYAELKEFCSE